VGVGTELGGRYRLTGTLATDQAGTVYRAEDAETGRAVAVRVFQEIGRHERSRLEGFHRAASRGTPRLELPSAFGTFHECDLTDDGRLFVVTELLEGPTVAELLRGTPPLDVTRALDLAIRIGEALEEVLNLGLFDLRVTPEDIVVPDAGDGVRLRGLDRLILWRLGLADRLTDSEDPGRGACYASPEELAGLSVTERSVVHRFGILLYELLAGAPPFPGTTPAEVREHQRRPLRARLRDRHRGLPASVDRLVARMLDPDPQARPGDLAGILNELWDVSCRLRGKAPARPPGTASSARTASIPPTGPARTGPWVLAGVPLLVLSGALLAWLYVAGGPTVRTAPPSPVRAALDAPTPSTGATPRLETASPDSGTEGDQVSRPETPAPETRHTPSAPSAAAGVPTARTAEAPPGAPSVARTESPLPSMSRKTASPPIVAAPAPPPSEPSAGTPAPSTISPPETPATVNPVGPAAPSPQPMTLPPLRPRPQAPENPRATDPGAIIDWLVRESPRVSE
jgi:serine/threonine-protein kinase